MKKENKLSHTYEKGVHMVDVGNKDISQRIAKARCKIEIPIELDTILKNSDYTLKKGAVLTISQVAGIIGAKKTSELIPLCHPLPITKCTVELIHTKEGEMEVLSHVECTGKTGVEMEALTACSIAALTFYDMCKSVSHEIIIKDLRLMHKSGGKSDFTHHDH